jgi:hypothetical protein
VEPGTPAALSTDLRRLAFANQRSLSARNAKLSTREQNRNQLNNKSPDLKQLEFSQVNKSNTIRGILSGELISPFDPDLNASLPPSDDVAVLNNAVSTNESNAAQSPVNIGQETPFSSASPTGVNETGWNNTIAQQNLSSSQAKTGTSNVVLLSELPRVSLTDATPQNTSVLVESPQVVSPLPKISAQAAVAPATALNSMQQQPQSQTRQQQKMQQVAFSDTANITASSSPSNSGKITDDQKSKLPINSTKTAIKTSLVSSPKELRTVKTSQLNNPPTNALPTVTKGTSLSPSSSPVSAKKLTSTPIVKQSPSSTVVKPPPTTPKPKNEVKTQPSIKNGGGVVSSPVTAAKANILQVNTNDSQTLSTASGPKLQSPSAAKQQPKLSAATTPMVKSQTPNVTKQPTATPTLVTKAKTSPPASQPTRPQPTQGVKLPTVNAVPIIPNKKSKQSLLSLPKQSDTMSSLPNPLKQRAADSSSDSQLLSQRSVTEHLVVHQQPKSQKQTQAQMSPSLKPQPKNTVVPAASNKQSSSPLSKSDIRSQPKAEPKKSPTIIFLPSHPPQTSKQPQQPTQTRLPSDQNTIPLQTPSVNDNTSNTQTNLQSNLLPIALQHQTAQASLESPVQQLQPSMPLQCETELRAQSSPSQPTQKDEENLASISQNFVDNQTQFQQTLQPSTELNQIEPTSQLLQEQQPSYLQATAPQDNLFSISSHQQVSSGYQERLAPFEESIPKEQNQGQSTPSNISPQLINSQQLATPISSAVGISCESLPPSNLSSDPNNNLFTAAQENIDPFGIHNQPHDAIIGNLDAALLSLQDQADKILQDFNT